MATGAKRALLREAVTKCHNRQEAETDMDRLTLCQIAKIKVMTRLVDSFQHPGICLRPPSDFWWLLSDLWGLLSYGNISSSLFMSFYF